MAPYRDSIIKEIIVDKHGFTIWFTGMPFSGKKKMAAMLAAKLESFGFKTKILDGGKIRREFNSQLGYSKEDIYQNIHRICFECKMLTENGIVAIAVTISPYRDIREECRNHIGEYVEIYCKAPLEELKKRDNKGLFKKAEKGEIKNVAGISAPFEEPKNPEVLIEFEHESLDEGLDKILAMLQKMGYIDTSSRRILTEEEEKDILERLKDMVNS